MMNAKSVQEQLDPKCLNIIIIWQDCGDYCKTRDARVPASTSTIASTSATASTFVATSTSTVHEKKSHCRSIDYQSDIGIIKC